MRAHCTAGTLYLVLLSGPPQVSHCQPQIQSQALGLVSSPPSGALVAQTCPLPDGPPPGSCSGRRGCKRKETNNISCFCLHCWMILFQYETLVLCCKTTFSASRTILNFPNFHGKCKCLQSPSIDLILSKLPET